MIRCVFDTNIILAGLRSPTGASRELLRRLGRKEIRVLASVPMLLEYEDVLKRPEHLRSINLTLEDVDVFIATVTTLIEPVPLYFLWRPQLRDPNDEIILEAAVNGQAQCIVTFNERDFRGGAHRFGIEVLRPGDFLRRIIV